MKTKFILTVVFVLFTFLSASSQSKKTKATIKVFGNCGMCKQRIETALDIPGIKMAVWDAKTKNLDVVYNARKVSETKIHEIVAAAGHDTEKVKAKDEVYAGLPFCCLYRDHDHSGMQDKESHH